MALLEGFSMGFRTRKTLHAASMAMFLLGLSVDHAMAQAPEPGVAKAEMDFHVAAQALSQAVIEFSRQAHVQLVVGAPLTKGVQCTAVQGHYSVSDALTRMLEGTGWTWRFLDDHTITIEPKTAANASSTRTFGMVQVEGANSPFPDVNGFGRGAGANGSSDVTATEGTGSLTTNGTALTDGSVQSLKETPQSITVITRTQIEQQNLTDLNSVLLYMPGVSMDVTSSVYSQPISRGFAVQSVQIDGGAPLSLVPLGGAALSSVNLASPLTFDMSEYDSVQLLRGSDALMSGFDQPGGVINVQRKRPLDHDQVDVDLQTGSWHNQRGEIDATGPLAFDGSLRGRVAFAYQDRDFYYDVSHQTLAHFYGVLEADLGADTLLRVGGSYGTNDASAINYGVPRYSDGGDLHLPRSTCFCVDENALSSKNSELFAELEHRFSDAWNGALKATRIASSVVEDAPYTQAAIPPATPLSAATGTFLGWNLVDAQVADYALDATLHGAIKLGGLSQQFTAGITYARNGINAISAIPFPPIPNAPFTYAPFNGVSVFGTPPQLASIVPANTAFYSDDNQPTEVYGGFLSLRLQPLSRLHVDIAARLTYQKQILDQGTFYNFGVPVPPSATTKSQSSNVPTPAISATYDITRMLSAYASYARVFQSNYGDRGLQDQTLPNTEGQTYEIGMKATPYDGALNLSGSIYWTPVNHQLQFDEGAGGVYEFLPGCCYVDLGKIVTKGVDLEAAGQILPGWQLHASYNFNETSTSPSIGINGGGAKYFSLQPKTEAKIWTSYALPGKYKAWTVGGGLRLESTRYTRGAVCIGPDLFNTCLGTSEPYNFTQGTYEVLDLMAGYRLTDHWTASLNLTNITDKTYYATAGTPSSGNLYGEPRAFMLSIKGHY
jgi:outer-membrane receptor for ferric coprogen and ferric-rhodotorulic acid